MKYKSVIILGTLLLSFFSVHFISQNPVTVQQGDTTTLVYSKEVKAVIDKKCYGCHSPEGRNEKAKEDLNWATLPTLAKSKQVAKLDEIIKVTKKGEMPPKQFVEKHPEAGISSEESKILTEWADQTANKLMK